MVLNHSSQVAYLGKEQDKVDALDVFHTRKEQVHVLLCKLIPLRRRQSYKMPGCLHPSLREV